MFVILLVCLLPSTILATDLQDLVLASNDFAVEVIEHEHVLEQKPLFDRTGGEYAQICQKERASCYHRTSLERSDCSGPESRKVAHRT
jgi:hypothetical protein